MPVLDPSVFVDDDVGGWTVVRRRCWSPTIDERTYDPRNQAISKNQNVGLLRSRAGAEVYWPKPRDTGSCSVSIDR
jgi:hypothetical protein